MAAVVVQAPVSALQDSFKALELSYRDKQFAKQQLSGEEKQASHGPRRYHAQADYPLETHLPDLVRAVAGVVVLEPGGVCQANR